jgi:hypothetical protein
VCGNLLHIWNVFSFVGERKKFSLFIKIFLNISGCLHQWYADQRVLFDDWYNSLSARKSYTKTKPQATTLFGQSYPVTTWHDVIIRTCEVLYIKNPQAVSAFDTNERLNTRRRKQFSRNAEDINQSPIPLSFGMFVEGNQSAESAVRLCEKMLEECGYAENEIQIEVREQQQ